jgi:two-component system sensor histidine kinase BaeS
VAHELRTPIANMRGYLELMADGVLEPDLALLKSLHEEAVLLSLLVEDLQDAELMDVGKLKLSYRWINPVEIIEKAVTATQHMAAEKEVDLKIELSAELPDIKADPDRLGQVLRNLLNNAVTHTPAGGHVGVEAHTQSGEIEVCVSDTGPGISEEHLPHIFDRFYRADQSRRRSSGGVGLGLAIVKELVEMQGGRVRAESLPGQGAAFYITLPLHA